MARLPPPAPASSGRKLLGGLALVASLVGLRALLRRWPRPRPLAPQGWGRSHRYRWRNEEVFFQHVGDGPPVVLVHSLGPGHDSAEWERAAALLAERWEAIAPDLPGWGRSPWLRGAPTAQVYVDFLTDFLAEVVHRPAFLVAAGDAAPFAVATAVALGVERIRGLALVAPVGLRGTLAVADPRQRVLRRAAGVPWLAGLAARALTSRGAIQRHLEHEVFAAPERADAAHRERSYRSARQRGARYALSAWLSGALAMDVREEATALRTPVWLGWGRLATAPPVEAADLWMHALPHADLEVFEGCGALPHAEAPLAFSRAITPFFDRSPP